MLSSVAYADETIIVPGGSVITFPDQTQKRVEDTRFLVSREAIEKAVAVYEENKLLRKGVEDCIEATVKTRRYDKLHYFIVGGAVVGAFFLGVQL